MCNLKFLFVSIQAFKISSSSSSIKIWPSGRNVEAFRFCYLCSSPGVDRFIVLLKVLHNSLLIKNMDSQLAKLDVIKALSKHLSISLVIHEVKSQ